MRRQFVRLALLLIIVLICWFYFITSSTVNLEEYPFLEPNNKIIKTNYTQLIRDLTIEPSNAASRGKLFIIIIVTSYAGHVELRSAHRRVMPQDLLQSMNITRIFLLAKIPPQEKYITQNAIEDESKAFGDILQGSFLENYHNLTFKHLMGLQWASTNCGNASYILKVDDDTVFNLDRTYNLMTSIKLEGDFFMGHLWTGYGKPKRNKQHKFYVDWDQYPKHYYPPFLSGWYYITTPNAARRITNEAAYHPFFWVDDLLITGLLARALKIKLVQLPQEFFLTDELLEICLRNMMNEQIMCDAAVGSNSRRNNFIVEFNDALSLCQNCKNCSVRSKDQVRA